MAAELMADAHSAGIPVTAGRGRLRATAADVQRRAAGAAGFHAVVDRRIADLRTVVADRTAADTEAIANDIADATSD